MGKLFAFDNAAARQELIRIMGDDYRDQVMQLSSQQVEKIAQSGLLSAQDIAATLRANEDAVADFVDTLVSDNDTLLIICALINYIESACAEVQIPKGADRYIELYDRIMSMELRRRVLEVL